MFKFDLRSRFSAATLFTAELDAKFESSPDGVKTGEAVKQAVLSGADLSGADLSGADLSGADLSGADLSGAVLSDRLRQNLTIPDLDAKILRSIESGAGELCMATWHTCETTHCRAGWAIVHAGAYGAAIEDMIGPAAAGALIYACSYPDLRVPNFYAADDVALADIRERAALANAPVADGAVAADTGADRAVQS